jgi:hypothetical protein
VDFLDELLALLEDLEKSDEDAELITNDDALGLREFTEVEGPTKFDALLDHYPEVFDQLEVTGREISITLIPGKLLGAGRETVTDRVVDFISATHDEVVYMTSEELLTEEIAECLAQMSAPGVSIRLTELSDSAED